MSWMEKKNQTILQKRIEEDKKLNQSLTFRPQISQKSLFNISQQTNREKVEDRLLKYQDKKIENLSKLEEKYLPAFKPN